MRSSSVKIIRSPEPETAHSHRDRTGGRHGRAETRDQYMTSDEFIQSGREFSGARSYGVADTNPTTQIELLLDQLRQVTQQLYIAQLRFGKAELVQNACDRSPLVP